ncbi:MAG: flagellar protein FliT [Lachnospiraceae bacterium]|nr:flagellar protein FliT [Lachnospiraceae bacterium]
MKSYISLMIESLQKKSKVLDAIIQKNQQQSEILRQEKVSFDAFDHNVLEKEELIRQLNRLDDGFDSIYTRIKEELQAHTSQYRSQISELQKLIQEITDKSVSIQTMEKRNKKSVEDYFRNTRVEMRQTRMSNRAASNYYKSMSRIDGSDYSSAVDEKK